MRKELSMSQSTETETRDMGECTETLFCLRSRETQTSDLISGISCPVPTPTLCETLYHKEV